MSKLSLISVNTTLEAAYGELTGRVAHLEGQLTVAVALIAKLQGQLKAAETQPVQQEQQSTESTPLDAEPTWWQQAGLKKISPPAAEGVECVAHYGFSTAEEYNPYAELVRSKATGRKCLVIIKPLVFDRQRAAGKFTMPPDTTHVCFMR